MHARIHHVLPTDVVTLSSLNRNTLAQRKDVGRTKVQMLKDYFFSICPETIVEVYPTFFTEAMAPTLLSGFPDYVLDCIDNTQTKVELMVYCKKNNIKLISAFGAGSANDPTKINVCDLKDSFGCVFGKTIRRHLRARGIHDGILVVVSTEIEKKKLIKLTDEELAIALTQEKRNVRLSKIGVAMPIPNIFGTVMANCVLSSLAQLPVTYKEERRVSGHSVSHQRVQKEYVKWEQDKHHTSPIESKRVISINDVKCIMDFFEGMSAISGVATGTGRFIRWRPANGVSQSNTIYVTRKEFDTHVKLNSPEELYSPELIEQIDQKLSFFANQVKKVEI